MFDYTKFITGYNAKTRNGHTVRFENSSILIHNGKPVIFCNVVRITENQSLQGMYWDLNGNCLSGNVVGVKTIMKIGGDETQNYDLVELVSKQVVITEEEYTELLSLKELNKQLEQEIEKLKQRATEAQENRWYGGYKGYNGQPNRITPFHLEIGDQQLETVCNLAQAFNLVGLGGKQK